ncbi:MAG TPA: HDOD domain-containing protein [Clostridiales bacterium]|nr:HDOD domain-containing protein [Clostridiales bacterium]
MDLLVIPVPFFDKHMAVQAYYFRYQEGNELMKASQATSEFDGAMLSPLLATLNVVGIDAFTMGKPIFVPVNNLMLLADLAQQCRVPYEKVIFVLSNDVKPEEPYLSRMADLKKKGFRFAIQKLDRVDVYAPIVQMCDYIFFDHRLMHHPGQQLMYALTKRNYPKISIVMTHINTNEHFEALRDHGPALFEGRFYRIPVTKGQHQVKPLKMNLIKLLNLVRDDNFEFSSVAEVVQQDTALTVSLMRMINSPFLGLRQKVKSVNHAVTILGQVETRKWVITAVSKLLGADRPDELTRLSLVRAKFAENLAPAFHLEAHAQSLFLMGLFSVLDSILELTMEEALQMVQVSDSIRDALLYVQGEYGSLLNFIYLYEAADWKTISRLLILYDLTPEEIYNAYLNALQWYKNLLEGADEMEEDLISPNHTPTRRRR